MASKKGISYKWRFFLPVVLSFWAILISMAVWQVIRVRQVKLDMIYDQLELAGERVAIFYDRGEYEMARDYMVFINQFYTESNRYDPISVIIFDSQGKQLFNIGHIDVNGDMSVLPSPMKNTENADSRQIREGIFTINSDYIKDYENDKKFIYGITVTDEGEIIYSLLPFSKVVARAVAGSTTKFWLILFGLAMIATISAYITTLFISRNIMVLRDFAREASSNPHFVVENDDEFPNDELGEISHQIVNIYNQRVMEMERREREHQIAIHAIEEKNRTKKELTSNISHELKTPAGVIQGYLDTIVDNPAMDPDTKDKFIFKTWEAAHRLTTLIQDITAITKLENGGKLVNVEEVNMHELAYSFSNYLEENDLMPDDMKFIYNVPLKCRIIGNESLLFAVLTNFTKNAIKYSQGTECHFELVGEDDDFCTFKFYDNGVGVPPEHLVYLFDRFYRVNSSRSRQTGGTGLGLSIVEVTITSLGGTISVANRYPSGLEFTFTLPKKKGKARSAQIADVPGDLT